MARTKTIYNEIGYHMTKEGQLNVAELIALLEKQPKDAIVYSEGCGYCYGKADRVEYDESDNSILISRL